MTTIDYFMIVALSVLISTLVMILYIKHLIDEAQKEEDQLRQELEARFSQPPIKFVVYLTDKYLERDNLEHVGETNIPEQAYEILQKKLETDFPDREQDFFMETRQENEVYIDFGSHTKFGLIVVENIK